MEDCTKLNISRMIFTTPYYESCFCKVCEILMVSEIYECINCQLKVCMACKENNEVEKKLKQKCEHKFVQVPNIDFKFKYKPLIKKLKFKCQFYIFGCNEALSFKAIQIHENKCNFKFISEEEKQKLLLLEENSRKKKNRKAFNNIQCFFCEDIIKLENMPLHLGVEGNCFLNHSSCIFCGEKVQNINSESHRKNCIQIKEEESLPALSSLKNFNLIFKAFQNLLSIVSSEPMQLIPQEYGKEELFIISRLTDDQSLDSRSEFWIKVENFIKKIINLLYKALIEKINNEGKSIHLLMEKIINNEDEEPSSEMIHSFDNLNLFLLSIKQGIEDKLNSLSAIANMLGQEVYAALISVCKVSKYNKQNQSGKSPGKFYAELFDEINSGLNNYDKIFITNSPEIQKDKMKEKLAGQSAKIQYSLTEFERRTLGNLSIFYDHKTQFKDQIQKIHNHRILQINEEKLKEIQNHEDKCIIQKEISSFLKRSIIMPMECRERSKIEGINMRKFLRDISLVVALSFTSLEDPKLINKDELMSILCDLDKTVISPFNVKKLNLMNLDVPAKDFRQQVNEFVISIAQLFDNFCKIIIIIKKLNKLNYPEISTILSLIEDTDYCFIKERKINKVPKNIQNNYFYFLSDNHSKTLHIINYKMEVGIDINLGERIVYKNSIIIHKNVLYCCGGLIQENATSECLMMNILNLKINYYNPLTEPKHDLSLVSTSNYVYSIGGKNINRNLGTCEYYHIEKAKWILGPVLNYPGPPEAAFFWAPSSIFCFPPNREKIEKLNIQTSILHWEIIHFNRDFTILAQICEVENKKILLFCNNNFETLLMEFNPNFKSLNKIPIHSSHFLMDFNRSTIFYNEGKLLFPEKGPKDELIILSMNHNELEFQLETHKIIRNADLIQDLQENDESFN